MPSRGRLSLIAPQHPRKPMTITNAPAAIKILAGREYPLLPRNASNCPGSISVHIPIPKMAAPASWKKDYKLEFWVYLSCHVCLHWFCPHVSTLHQHFIVISRKLRHVSLIPQKQGGGGGGWSHFLSFKYCTKYNNFEWWLESLIVTWPIKATFSTKIFLAIWHHF